jgi:hypothetical protein
MELLATALIVMDGRRVAQRIKPLLANERNHNRAPPMFSRQCSAAVWRQDFADLNRTMDNELYAPFFREMSHLQYRLMRAFGAYHVGF